MVLYLLLGAAFGAFGAYAYRLLPSKWLCDYNTEPTDKEAAASRRLRAGYYVAFAAISALCTMLAARDANMYTAIFTAPLCCVLLLLAKADAQYSILPNELMLMALIAGLPLAFRGKAWAPVAGCVICAGVCAVVGVVASKLAHTDAMGMGDVLLAGLAGFICGYGSLVQLAVAAVFSAAICYAALMAAHRLTIKSAAPFGPFLVFGILFTICLAPEWTAIINRYFSLLGI